MVTISEIGGRFRWEMLATVVNSTVGILLVVILARLLNPDGYGLLFLTLSILGVIQVFADLGLKGSTGRYIAEYKENQIKQVPKIIEVTATVVLVLTFFTSLVIVFRREYIASIIQEPRLSKFLLIGVLFLIFRVVYVYSRVVFQGFELIKKAAIISILYSTSKLIFALLLVYLGFESLGAFIGYTLSAVVTAVASVILLYNEVYKHIDSAPAIESGLTRRILEYSVPMTATRGARILDKKIDILLIGFFLNPATVGYYAVAKQVGSVLKRPARALGFTLGPTFGSETAAGNYQHAARIFEKSITNLLLLYVPASTGLIILSSQVIRHVIGENYIEASLILKLFGIFLIFSIVNQVASPALNYLGKAKIRAVMKTITSAVNLVLNVVLIPRLGPVGAALATVITFGAYTSINFYYIYRELPLEMFSILSDVSKISMISFLMGTAVVVLRPNISSIQGLLLAITMGITIWGILSVLFGLMNTGELKEALL